MTTSPPPPPPPTHPPPPFHSKKFNDPSLIMLFKCTHCRPIAFNYFVFEKENGHRKENYSKLGERNKLKKKQEFKIHGHKVCKFDLTLLRSKYLEKNTLDISS